MSKTSRALFLIAGAIFPILIGVLHTYVHFNDLVQPEVESFLQKEISILGESQPIWFTWGIVSFMMGVSFIVIGLLNISVLNRLKKEEYPPTIPLLAMVLYLVSVIYVGYEFEQAPQFYGGIFGLILIGGSGFLKITNK